MCMYHWVFPFGPIRFRKQFYAGKRLKRFQKVKDLQRGALNSLGAGLNSAETSQNNSKTSQSSFTQPAGTSKQL